METAHILLIVLAVFIALFLAVFQYIYKKQEKSQLNYWLSFLRFLSLFSLFLLLINPSIKKATAEIIKPNLVVLVDNSISIQYKSQTKEVRALLAKIKEDNDLNTKFNIQYYSFGNVLNPLDSLNFTAQHTNLFEPVNTLSKVYTSTVSPLVLITDGNQTSGNAVEFLDYKSAVYPFIVGDTSTVDDIYINQLNVNKATFINNQFPVEVFVNYSGKNNVSKNLNVYHKREKLYSKQLNFSRTDNVKTVSLFLKAENKGNQYYTVKIETLENEQNIVNNSKEFSINVIEDKSKILLLTSIIHPDLGMFKKSIESNKQRSVDIFNIKKYKGNIQDYQLVILYQPNNKFKDVLNEIQTNKNNYLIVSGLSTDWQFLNSAQNNFSKKAIASPENYHPVLNNAYASFMNSDIGFSSFAPLEDQFGGIIFNIPYQTLLFQKIGNIITENPLLASFEIDNQKGAILFGENSWRWRMNSFNDYKSFELFDGFMANLMQYLASNVQGSRLSIAVNTIYYSNETIQFTANYLDENLNLDNRVKVWLTVSNKEKGFLNKTPFALENRLFKVELSNIPEGEYNYTVSVENYPQNVSGSFKILPFEIEQQFTQSNDKDLKLLASKTNGEIYYNSQDNSLLHQLKSDERYRSTQKINIIKTPLIDWKWLLFIIVLFLSVEWFIRKYFGKI